MQCWKAVGVTCRSTQQLEVLQEELSRLQSKGVFRRDVPLLTIQDPCEKVGSGGSTLNALLVIAEHLSALEGHSVLTSDVLINAHILIIHLGHDFVFDPCGRAFITFPESFVSKTGCQVQLTPFISLYRTLTNQLAGCNSPEGVWVSGSDAFFTLEPDFLFRWPSEPRNEIVVFTLPVDRKVAESHGIYRLDADRVVRDLFYREREAEKVAGCVGEDGKVALVLALLFLPLGVAEQFLSLHSLHPLTSATYLGVDSGAVGLKLSLFFDFLLPCCADSKKTDFTRGFQSSYGEHQSSEKLNNGGDDSIRRNEATVEMESLVLQARKVLSVILGQYRIRAEYLPVRSYHYFSNNTSEHLGFCRRENVLYPEFGRILNTNLKGEADDDSEIKLIIRLRSNEHQTTQRLACVFFDEMTDFDARFDPNGTHLSKTMTDLKQSLSPGFQFQCGERLTNQKIFPVVALDCSEDGYELVSNEIMSKIACQGLPDDLSVEYMSLTEISRLTDTAFYFERKRDRNMKSQLEVMKRVLLNKEDVCLLPLFKSLCVDGYSDLLLSTLDDLGCECGRLNVVGRVLSSVADVLGVLGEGRGGLRSGPAANIHWQPALAQLENHSSMAAGIRGLALVRANWMGSPERLIRASRHYEAAAQITTRRAVMDVKKYIVLREGVRSGGWCVAESAVRIDVSGGWSDTPPITNHNGGAVLNIAILVDGKKPVRAKCRAVKENGIRLEMRSGEFEQNLVLDNLQEIERYCNPSAPGALVCAVLVCNGVVDTKSKDSLETQISSCFGADCRGLEIQCWSDLPQGSGLGTSSILAGCLLAVVWKAMGKDFEYASLLHAVLYVEQLLTTGGGWQDQVGGLTPGIKIGRFGNTPATARITVQYVPISPEAVEDLSSRLVLVYTGKARLAKNLLQEVVRNWYSRRRDGPYNVVDTVTGLVANAEKCFKAASEGDWDRVGECAREYWTQKKRMAPGCEPRVVRELLESLYEKQLITAGWLAGAGGGGFLYLFLKRKEDRDQVYSHIHSNESYASMTIHSVSIDLEALTCYTDNSA